MITHAPNLYLPWAVCGEETFIYTDDAPTCLGCAAGVWLAADNQQMRLLNHLSSQMPAMLKVPSEYLGITVTSTSNSIEVKPTEVLSCSSNTLKVV